MLSLSSEWKRVLRFTIVGCSGVAVNMVILTTLIFAGIPDLASLAIAIELSILNNFVWNDRWTFGEEFHSRKFLNRLGLFQLVSIGGGIINWLLYLFFTRIWGIEFILANLVSIFIVFVWNYLTNKNVTWKKWQPDYT